MAEIRPDNDSAHSWARECVSVLQHSGFVGWLVAPRCVAAAVRRRRFGPWRCLSVQRTTRSPLGLSAFEVLAQRRRKPILLALICGVRAAIVVRSIAHALTIAFTYRDDRLFPARANAGGAGRFARGATRCDRNWACIYAICFIASGLSERCRSSGVEHSLGKGEVESSNLSGSTTAHSTGCARSSRHFMAGAGAKP